MRRLVYPGAGAALAAAAAVPDGMLDVLATDGLTAFVAQLSCFNCSEYVAAAVKKVIGIMGQGRGRKLVRMHMWSDGCPPQFKSRITTAMLQQLSADLDLPIMRHFTAIEGIRAAHAMCILPDGSLRTAMRSCCCAHCMGQPAAEACDGAAWKGSWEARGGIGSGEDGDEEELPEDGMAARLLALPERAWVAVPPRAGLEEGYRLVQLQRPPELLVGRAGRPPHVNDSGAPPQAAARVLLQASVAVEVGSDGPAEGVELPKTSASAGPWFDDTYVAAVGLPVQLEQRSGDAPGAAVGRRGAARASKSAARSLTARTFAVLDQAAHDEVLDAVVLLLMAGSGTGQAAEAEEG